MIALLVTSVLSSSVADVIARDQCSSAALLDIRPRVQTAVAALKQNINDMEAAQSLIQSYNEAEKLYNDCHLQEKIVDNYKGDPIKFAGISLLLASNCFKDLGAVLLIFDSVLLDPSDIENDVIVAIFVTILGLQSYKDCSQLIHYIA